ncbi:hypothetical protein LCGC14_1914620, partial [marine sediment metagenome]
MRPAVDLVEAGGGRAGLVGFVIYS